ncbi:MAG: hypothetical protein AB7F88_07005 [Pyrinomonadaceae bacterium]
MKVKLMKKRRSEKEIDEKVIAHAEVDTYWTAFELVKRRAERGDREKFLKALSKVPTVEPDPEDRFE